MNADQMKELAARLRERVKLARSDGGSNWVVDDLDAAADPIDSMAQDAERRSSDARHRTQAGSFLDAARGGGDGD